MTTSGHRALNRENTLLHDFLHDQLALFLPHYRADTKGAGRKCESLFPLLEETLRNQGQTHPAVGAGQKASRSNTTPLLCASGTRPRFQEVTVALPDKSVDI